MYLIDNGKVITVDPQRRVFRNGAVLVDGQRIAAVGTSEQLRAQYPDVEVLDVQGSTVLPGLVNVHAHLFQSLYRGLGDDLSLADWITKCIYPMSTRLFAPQARIGALLNELEMIKTGTTTFNDSHYINIDKGCQEAIASATEEIGMRGIIGRAAINHDPVPKVFWETPDEAYAECARVIGEVHGMADGRITVRVEPMSETQTTREMVLAMRAVASEFGVGLNIHAAETKGRIAEMQRREGKRTIEYLNDLGVLAPDVCLAHCVYVEPHEIEMIKASGAGVGHQSVSNQYLSDGVAPIPEYLAAGIPVGIGADGAASNNNQDMFQAMKAAVLMQKVSRLEPESLTAEQAIEMATIGGARALAMDDEIGSLEVGKKADIIVVSNRSPEMHPTIAFVSNLVYSATGSLVETTIIDGRIVMRDRVMTTIDEEALLGKIDQTTSQMIVESGTEHLLSRSNWTMI